MGVFKEEMAQFGSYENNQPWGGHFVDNNGNGSIVLDSIRNWMKDMEGLKISRDISSNGLVCTDTFFIAFEQEGKKFYGVSCIVITEKNAHGKTVKLRSELGTVSTNCYDKFKYAGKK